MTRSSLARHLLVDGARTLTLLAGGRPAVAGGLVLAYHDIGDDSSNTTNYYLPPRQLRRQLQWVRDSGLRFVDLLELSQRVAAGRDVDGLVAVCFDDSLAGVHHHAMPVLIDLGVPATVFAVSAALGGDPAWWPGATRVMTRGEVEEWVAAGLQVGSHTRSHASLPALDGAGLTDEVKGSRAELEDLIQAPVPIFAYPFGHYDPRVREQVVEAGYLCAYTFLNGRITTGDDTFRLPRLNMWSGHRRARLAYHLARSPLSWPPHQFPEVLAGGGLGTPDDPRPHRGRGNRRPSGLVTVE
jgi:peptidoglycan/xylan/chitin deacetylase (PgdA/CDA1 family)